MFTRASNKSVCGGGGGGVGKTFKNALQGPWPGPTSVSVRRLDQHCPAAKTTTATDYCDDDWDDDDDDDHWRQYDIIFVDVSERRPLPIM